VTQVNAASRLVSYLPALACVCLFYIMGAFLLTMSVADNIMMFVPWPLFGHCFHAVCLHVRLCASVCLSVLYP